MADIVYGLNKGQHLTDVATSSATMGLDLEVVVDLAAGRTTKQVLDGLEIIGQAIFDTRAKPFAQ